MWNFNIWSNRGKRINYFKFAFIHLFYWVIFLIAFNGKKLECYATSFLYELYDTFTKYEERFYRTRKRFEIDAENKLKIIKQNKSLTWKEVIIVLSRRQKTEFYAPLQSFWPLFISFSLGLFLILLVAFFHNEKIVKIQGLFLLIFLISISVGIAFWFAIFFLEKTQGNHNFKIIDNIEMGFFLFLFTEALCFISLFWVFLHSMLAASIHVGLFNPGEGVANFFINETLYLKTNWNELFFHETGTPGYFNLSSEYNLSNHELHNGKTLKIHVNFYDKGQLINPYKLPLLNTFILLTSAATLNLSHLSLKKSKFLSSCMHLICTIILGFFFVYVQYKEYKECTLQYNDGIYAACFFSLTGLHGFHVILGLFCLIICFFNLLLMNYSKNFHQSFHYSILYWHFVDIIWIVVYFVIYLWPSSYFFKGEFHSFWIDYNSYVVNFSKKDVETGVKNKIMFEIMKNNQNIFFYTINENFIFDKKKNESMDYNLFNELLSNVINNSSEISFKEIKNKKTNEFLFITEFILFDWYQTKDACNYNKVKKDPYAYCFIINMMHAELFAYIEGSFFLEFEKNPKKILFWAYLFKFNTVLSYFYTRYFMGYLLDYYSVTNYYSKKVLIKNAPVWFNH